MAFSTQQFFFFLPYIRSCKNNEDKSFCLQIREYNTIYDDRSWSLNEQQKSNYFKDILQYTASDFEEYIKKSQDISKDFNHNVWNTKTIKLSLRGTYNFFIYCINLIQTKIQKFRKDDLNMKDGFISKDEQEPKNKTYFLIDLSKNVNLLLKKYNMEEKEKEALRTMYDRTRILLEQNQKLKCENKHLQFIINSTNKISNIADNQQISWTIQNLTKNGNLKVEQTAADVGDLGEILNTARLKKDDHSSKANGFEVKNQAKLEDDKHKQMSELQREKEKLENEVNTLKAQLRVAQFEAQKAECLQLENKRLCTILSQLRDLEVECQNMKILYNM